MLVKGSCTTRKSVSWVSPCETAHACLRIHTNSGPTPFAEAICVPRQDAFEIACRLSNGILDKGTPNTVRTVQQLTIEERALSIFFADLIVQGLERAHHTKGSRDRIHSGRQGHTLRPPQPLSRGFPD